MEVISIISKRKFSREFNGYNQLNIPSLMPQFKGCSAKMVTIIGDGVYFSKTKTYLIIWVNNKIPCYAWVDESQVGFVKFIKETNQLYIGDELQETNNNFDEIELEDIMFRVLKENMEVY